MKNQRTTGRVTIFLLTIYMVIFHNIRISEAVQAPPSPTYEITALVLKINEITKLPHDKLEKIINKCPKYLQIDPCSSGRLSQDFVEKCGSPEPEILRDLVADYMASTPKNIGYTALLKTINTSIHSEDGIKSCGFIYQSNELIGKLNEYKENIVNPGCIIQAKVNDRGDECSHGSYLSDINLVESSSIIKHPECDISAYVMNIQRATREISLSNKELSMIEQYEILLKIQENNSSQKNSNTSCHDIYPVGSEITGIISSKAYNDNPIFLGQKINANIWYGGTAQYNGHFILENKNSDNVNQITTNEKEALQKKVHANLSDYMNTVQIALDRYRQMSLPNEERIKNIERTFSTLEFFKKRILVEDMSDGEVIFSGVLLPNGLDFFDRPGFRIASPCNNFMYYTNVISAEKGYDWIYDNCFKWKEFRGYKVGSGNGRLIHLTDAKDISPVPQKWLEANMDAWKKKDDYQWLKEVKLTTEQKQ